MRVSSGVLMVLLLCGSPAMAQQASWGVKGGVNVASLSVSDDPAPDFDYRIGLVAGGFFTMPIAGRLDVQPEVLFSQQGASIADDMVDAKVEIDSLVAPILVRYRLQSSGQGLVIFGGPSFGFTLRARAVAEIGGEKTETDIGDDIKTVDYGVVFGAGWERGRFSIDGRYSWGLSGIGADEGEGEHTTHRVIGVMAGVRF